MFTEDLELYFDINHGFAVPASLNGSKPVPVIFDDEYYAVKGEDVDISSSVPAAQCQTLDVAAAEYGDRLTVIEGDHAGEYNITNIKPDGTGITILALERL